MKRVRIAKPAKFIKSLVFIFLMLYLTTLALSGSLISVGANAESYIQYTVVEGDTLWTIAQVYTPQRGDVRETLHVIQKHNDKFNANIMPGEILYVPSTGEDL